MDFNIHTFDVNISSKFNFQGPGLNVKVDMTEIFSIM